MVQKVPKAKAAPRPSKCGARLAGGEFAASPTDFPVANTHGVMPAPCHVAKVYCDEITSALDPYLFNEVLT